MSSNNSSNAGEGDVCNKKSTFKPEETVKEIIEIEEVEEVADPVEEIVEDPVVLEEGKDGQDANTDETAEPIVLSSDDVVIEAEVVETIPEPVPQPEIIEVEELSEDNSDPPQQNN